MSTVLDAVSLNVAQIKESATIAVSNKAKALKAAGRVILDLGAGEPDFDTPEYIRRAAQRAIDGGATHYTATEGILPLRQAIAAEANALYTGPDRIEPADVVVSTGSKQSLFNACFTLFGPGDEVLIPTPSWTSYYEMVSLARATAVPVYGDIGRGLRVTAPELAAAATSRTRGVLLNSPSNPTGSVYSAEELSAILALAAERGWWVISDEIYRYITYGVAAPSALELATSRDNLVVINGVAKAYAMTGWRIGWAIAPRHVAAAMTALQSHTTSNPATVSQHAALAALNEPDAARAAIAAMVDVFRQRRDAAVEILDAAGVTYVRPDGAFYLYIRVGDGDAFAQRLLETQGVAVVPGAAFLTNEWVRLSYAAPTEQVLEGVRRLVAAIPRPS
ncbi:MAG TPA: pyridoxal phosphate-dependent aminotransferase [Gemmatimonadaceae bacterium]|nr:pyridoxal phosphate-dependent aminotransferase [Gemmatimonadaceae bacterium]